jgi:uncharacterized protein
MYGSLQRSAGIVPLYACAPSLMMIQISRRIKVLSEWNEIENYDFRAWLKNYAPDDIDDVVKALSQKYFALIDCKECANYCRVLELKFTEPELHTIAKSMEQSIDEFKKRFVVEGIMKPCPALKGNLCSIYEGRPDVYSSYPHLEKPDLISKRVISGSV